MRVFVVVVLISAFAGTKTDFPSCLTPILYPDDDITPQPPYTKTSGCFPRPSEYEMCKFANTQNMHEVLRSIMKDQSSHDDLFYFNAHNKDGLSVYTCERANATYATNENGLVTFTLSFGITTITYTEMKSGAFELWVDRGCFFTHFKSFAFPTCVNGVISIMDCRLDADDDVDASLLGRLGVFHVINNEEIAQINSEFPLLNFSKSFCDNLW